MLTYPKIESTTLVNVDHADLVPLLVETVVRWNWNAKRIFVLHPRFLFLLSLVPVKSADMAAARITLGGHCRTKRFLIGSFTGESTNALDSGAASKRHH